MKQIGQTFLDELINPSVAKNTKKRFCVAWLDTNNKTWTKLPLS